MTAKLLTSKPGGFRAGGIVTHENKLLLMHVVRAGENPEEFYMLPGGHHEEGETLKEACVREIEEEFGITVTPEELEFVVVGTRRVAFYFRCKYNG